MTYYATPCQCGDPLCKDWHVKPVAAYQGVCFTEQQARAVAAVLNSSENGGDHWDSGPIFPITKNEAEVLHSLGWESGFGWEDQWDWWIMGEGPSSAENADVRLRLVEHLTKIRHYRNRAAQSASLAISMQDEF